MRKVFLHIFSGSGGLSQAVAAHGIGVVNVDTAIHPSLDLLDDRIFQLLVGWISTGKVAGIWVGTPCNSFSRARRGKPRPDGRGMPVQLRSATFPEGLPHRMSANDEQAVRLGNALASRARRLLVIAEKRRLPSAEENPFQSFLWSLPSRVKSDQHQDHKVDYCFFGTAWRARTRIRTHSFRWMHAPPCCSGRGVCSFSGLPHDHLSGSAPQHRGFKTKLKQAYPIGLCKSLAKDLSHAMLQTRVSQVWSQLI